VVGPEPVPVSWDQITPRLRRGVRLCHDQVRGQDALLHPEGVALLNPTAAATLALVDGKTSVAQITDALSRRFRGVRDEDILSLLDRLEEARLVELTPSDSSSLAAAAWCSAAERPTPLSPASRRDLGSGAAHADSLPLGLLAELTHRCPLHCPYCSNPLELTAAAGELPTSTWLDILGQARRLGVLQAHLSGGEPLLRRDLEPLAAGARSRGMYVNLVTSGVGPFHRPGPRAC
jgi:PqqA peptide cyclase